MAVLAMDKIQILGMKKDLQPILALLQKEGLMQIDEVKSESEIELEKLYKKDHEVDYAVAKLDFAIGFLKDYAPKRPIWVGKPALTLEEALKTVKDFDYEKVVKETEELEENLNTDKNEADHLKAQAALLEDWTHLPFDLDTERETETTRIHLGTISVMDYEKLREEMDKLSKLNSIQKIASDQSTIRVIVVISKKHTDEAKLLLSKFKFQEVDLPVYNMSVSERLKAIKSRLKELDGKMKTHEETFKRLAKDYEKLQVAHDVFIWQQDENNVHERLKGSDFSFIIEGWVAKLDRKKLEEKLSAIAVVAIEDVKLEEDEQAPIYLHNKRAVKPFESVTRLYGFPKASEVDPTPFLAIFFIVFFGLCLTDAGYGLSLFIIMFLALKFFKLPKESLGLIKLLMWGGIVTMVAGVFFGGYFGMTIEQAPAFLVDGDHFKWQIINPSQGNGPLTFLIFAMVLGIVHVIFGIMVNGYWKIRQKQYLDALLDSGLWLYFIVVLLSWALSKAGILVPGELSGTLVYFVYAGVALLILTQGRNQKGILKKFGIGVLSLYNLVGYFGDVLSYSRLMALGLGTGIIAFAMNTIAGLANDMIPYVGFIFGFIVLIIGHLLNLVLSALGAFIHSARLQFVEFFSKFMEGGGSEFKPFRRECKYIVIK